MKIVRFVAAAAALIAVPGLAGCGTSSAAPAPGTVLARNIAFNPGTITAKVGDTVTWKFSDSGTAHNVDGKAGLPDFYSGDAQTSGTWAYTFKQAGTYLYKCDIHPSMIGRVVVS